MLKQTLIGLSLATIFSAGVALAEDKAAVEPGKGTGPTDAMNEAVPTMKPAAPGVGAAAPAAGTTAPAAATTAPAPGTAAAPAPAAAGATANASCVQADLAALITKAGALTDKDKQRMTMGHLDLAQKSLNQKDVEGCSMHLKEASSTMGIVTK